MRLVLLLTVWIPAVSAVGGEVMIDDFEGQLGWTPFSGHGGPVVDISTDSEHFAEGRASLRLKYEAAEPFWSNLRRPVTVPPDAVGVAMSIMVHSAQPKAKLTVWLNEPDRDRWVARIDSPLKLDSSPVKTLDDFTPGWHDVVVPIADFGFQPSSSRPYDQGSRQMVSVSKLQIGCSGGDLDVSVDRLRFVTSEESIRLPTTANLVAEDGRLGRVAVLADDLPTGPGAASPKKVAAVVRKADYGVTLLKSGDVADSSTLSSKMFDVLIVPCGPSYPRQGRNALLDFLSSGGSLVTIGGYAFDNLLTKTADGWTNLTVRADDMLLPLPRRASEVINTRFGKAGNARRLDPRQIGVFDPSYLLEHVAYAETAPNQMILNEPLRIAGPLEGFAASVMAGSNINAVFSDIHARWIPVVNAYDRFGRLRGAVLSVARHWRGPFAGSSWALLGVTNRDLISDDPAGPTLLAAALNAVVEPAFLHDAKTDLACYRQGETVRASVAVTNHGHQPRRLSVRFRAEELTPVVKQVSVAAGETQKVAVVVHEGPFDDDFYTVTAELLDPTDESNATVVDRISTGFVVWDEDIVMSGPKIEFKDNYFTFDDVPRFFCGSNQTGMMWHGQNEGPLVWEADFAKMEASGMRMLRILHFPPFAADDPPRWREQGVGVLKHRPKRLLRQTDAIVQIAQKHQVVVFLSLHDWMPVKLSDAELELQRDWGRFWSRRYRHVPGIIYDIQNEPAVGPRAPSAPGSDDWGDRRVVESERKKVDTLNKWILANVEGIREGNPDALATVGFLQTMHPADKILGTTHTDFSNMHYYGDAAQFAAEFKLIDRRFVGKSFSLGEFGARGLRDARCAGRIGTAADRSIRYFLTITHDAIGMGASFALNWDWKDFDACVFPWGLNHSCDLVDKRLLPAYRNMSLFLERLRPRYEDPGVYLLLPDSHRLGPRYGEIHEALRESANGLIACRVDFNVANEKDIDRLPPTCRTIVWPIPYCPSDATFDRVLRFVREGGRLYISGDVAYDPTRQRTRASRLVELGLNDPGGKSPFEDSAGSGLGKIQTSTVGRGSVFFVPTPIELRGGPVVMETLGKFLDFAGEKRIAVEPDVPGLRVFRLPLVDAMATVVINRSTKDQNVRLEGAELAVGKDLAGLIAKNGRGEVFAVECTGYSASDDRPLTSGVSHVMIAALDDADVRQSTRLAIYPITAGSLSIHTSATWDRPILEVGRFVGPAWETLSTIPLTVEAGKLTFELDDDLARSILMLREADAPTAESRSVSAKSSKSIAPRQPSQLRTSSERVHRTQVQKYRRMEEQLRKRIKSKEVHDN